MEQLTSPEAVKVRADVDMLALIGKYDPLVYLVSSRERDALKTRGDYQHTTKHAAAVISAAIGSVYPPNSTCKAATPKPGPAPSHSSCAI